MFVLILFNKVYHLVYFARNNKSDIVDFNACLPYNKLVREGELGWGEKI